MSIAKKKKISAHTIFDTKFTLKIYISYKLEFSEGIVHVELKIAYIIR